MRAILRGIMGENGSLRGLTGQGEPGLWTLLGGTNAELDAGGRRLAGGKAQLGAAARERILGGAGSRGGWGEMPAPIREDVLDRDWRDRYRRER